MRKLLMIMAAILALSGCKTYDVDEILMVRSDVSLTHKGILQFSYDPLTCQMAHSPTNDEFRVFDDELANWFTVKCDDKPTEVGQTLTATVSWTTATDTKKESDLEFQVHRIDKTGKIWMWNDSKDIGVVIQEL